MTPEERARLILQPYFPNDTNLPLRDAIADAICEAYEQAAKMAETCDTSPTDAGYTERERIAQSIRRLSSE